MAGLYIHVPFCKRKCPYCDFYSVKLTDESKTSDFTKAVIRNLKPFKNTEIETVYFGGGTPSLLSGEDVSAILDSIRNTFILSADAEITMEINPSSATKEKLLHYKSAGVNRLSFGVQSSDDNELKTLGRLHNFDEAKNAVTLAAGCGFENISCDLMIGVVGQNEESLKKSIDDLALLPIKHISAYMLKIEENTPYNCDEIISQIPDDDKMSDLYLIACEHLEKKGFMQYEVSNFAYSGFESRHNTKYWELDDYIGIGPSAHSFFKNVRYSCPDSIDEFVSKPFQSKLITDAEPDMIEEYIMLGLRLKKGISVSKLNELGANGNAVLRMAQLLESHGYVKINDNVISLTREGYLVSNAVINELLEYAI